MYKNTILFILVWILLEIDGKQINRQELSRLSQVAYPQVIRLAENEKFIYPIDQKTTSYEIKYHPSNKKKQCRFQQSTVSYKSIISKPTQMLLLNDVVLLKLKEKEKLIAASSNKIIIYSLDKHNMLSIIGQPIDVIQEHHSQINNQGINGGIAIVIDKQEDNLYYITSDKYYIYDIDSLGMKKYQIYKIYIYRVKIFKFQEQILSIIKAIQYKGYIFILCFSKGLFIYKINFEKQGKLSLKQTIIHQQKYSFNKSFDDFPQDNSKNLLNQIYNITVDFQIDQQRQLIYLLLGGIQGIKVYNFKQQQFPNQENLNNIIHQYDIIDLTYITQNHGSKDQQYNMNLNLQLSSDQSRQQLFILFKHSFRTVIAQIIYNSFNKQFTFIRYFKFEMIIFQIYTISNYLIVVGEDIIGLFPYGIHPKLIQEEVNGLLMIHSEMKLLFIDQPHFVAFNQTVIQYAELIFNYNAGIHCQFSDSRQIKSITLNMNITGCSQEDLYYTYCEEKKNFKFEQIDIAATNLMADIIETGFIIFSLLVLLGICIMLIMYKRKKIQIQKLAKYFESRKQQIPAQSDRRQQIPVKEEVEN